jgi:deazaflavin-dependent oxidoreductase (nitroreductase family)
MPPRGHAPFAVFNRTGNQAVRGLLLSPLHPLVSRRLALITVTGRRTGREYTFPVGYRQDADRVTITIAWARRKVWWRNLLEGGRVRLRLRGQERTGHAQAVADEQTGVRVEVQLDTPERG